MRGYLYVILEKEHIIYLEFNSRTLQVLPYDPALRIIRLHAELHRVGLSSKVWEDVSCFFLSPVVKDQQEDLQSIFL